MHFKKTAKTEVASTRARDAAELGIDGQSGDSDAGEGIKLSVEQIGFRTCGISGCEQILHGDQSSGKDNSHYWNWHHADSIARCADHGCQMLFSSREGLQAHYEQRHTVFRCYKCFSHDPEAFTLEDELRQHWRLFHLQKVKRWICVFEAQGSAHVAVRLQFEGCTDCVHGKTYDRRYDALKHLKAVHVDSEAELGQGPLSFSLLDIFVKEVWDYKVEEETGSEERNEEHPRWDSDGSDEENLIEPDDMFYVAELA
ncbi:hypothetical protein DL771_006362 [Monosporascus sp. 5C6A]|nr:hypothetical protein DL771_006362 [Monosporascus sp. 5C6A]